MSLVAFICVILLVPISVSTPLALSDDKPSAYQALHEYDFPSGLLPQGVIGYELNRDTGEFSAYLNGTCSFSIESYELRYKSTIKGVISKDSLENLQGVSVKILFFWVNIVEVIRDELQFSVGIASAYFPIDNFVGSPQCGCGLNCNNLITFASSS